MSGSSRAASMMRSTFFLRGESAGETDAFDALGHRSHGLFQEHGLKRCAHDLYSRSA